MPVFPKTKIAVGHQAAPGQWYLPGTDIARLPDPASGSPSGGAFAFYSETGHGWKGWSAGPWWRKFLSVTETEVTWPDGRTEIRQDFRSLGGWNAVKNISVRTEGDAYLAFEDFVHVDVDASGRGRHGRDGDDHGSTIVIDGAKRGNVVTGEDNDSVWIRPLSNGDSWGNEIRIATGDGSDAIRIATTLPDRPELFGGKRLVADGSLTTVRIDAGGGNDFVHLGGAREIVDGGAGSRDTAIYDGATEGVIAFLNEVGVVTPQKAQMGRGGAAGDILINVERLKGSPFNDVLHGNSGDNDLISGRGDDVMTGGAGHDHFILDLACGIDVVTDFTVGEDTVEVRGAALADIHQEVVDYDGTEGLLVWLSHRPGYDVSTIFLEGVTAELTPGLHGGGEPNWHDAVMLS